MEAKDTDIFISYRRIDGRDIARTIQLALGKEGFEHVFFDYSSMREGMFNEQIITAINHCKDYILVLSPQSMLRCSEPQDWVARELQTAIDAGCKIIPVQINDPFDAWPDDFPKKFNFIKQIEFLTLRTDEYFSDSIRRLIGWLDSKPTLIDNTQDGFTLSVHVDETCELYVDGVKLQKVKCGKTAIIKDLKPGQNYTLKLISLAQKNNEIEVNYLCPDNTIKSGDITVSFIEERKQRQQEADLQRKIAAEVKEQARMKSGMLMQACENYDESWVSLKSDMTAVSLRGKIGFLNENGFEAVACEYDDVCEFNGDYATVCKNGKWGIIDQIGQVVVPFFSDTPCWPHGAFNYFVSSRNDHFAISTIKRGIPDVFPYDEVLILVGHDNLFAVKKDSLWSIIDIKGGISPFTLQVKSISGYGGSYSSFLQRWDWEKRIEIECPLRVQHPITNRWGYLNSRLKLTVPFVDEGGGENTYNVNWEIIKTNGHMGLVNVETGEFIIPAIYDNIHQYYRNGAFDFLRISDAGAGYKCTKDRNGNVVSEDSWVLWGGMQGIANANGEIIVPQHYQYIELYENNADEENPFFAAYVLKDLKLSWGNPDYTGSAYLNKTFNKEQSFIHVYSSKGAVLGKIRYKNECQIREMIKEEEKRNKY